MNTLRPIQLVLALALLVPVAALASSPGANASLLWLQGAAVDDVYDQAQAPVRDIRVQVWHDREDDDPYRRGENLQVHFRTNADMYVALYRLDVDGRVEMLWPTSRYDDGFVYGNHTYTLPRPGSPVRLTVSERKGVEYVQAIASEYPFDLRELGIDFAFDLDAPDHYGYAVSGDPFLAVNDINFAITGLEEDVDYVVTDWTHLYVESKVDYARYSCTQCHQGDDGDTYVHPYVDTCKTVNVYTDFGWHRSWYANFGWYPLYYDAPYYYWDVVYARPYWFSYYPIYYSWYSYPVYARGYPLYRWHDSPWYAGDYRVRYRKGVTRTAPLYDVASPGTRGRLREDGARRDANALPPSIARATRNGGTDGRVDPDRLVRSGVPSRERSALTPRTEASDRTREVGVRSDRPRTTQRRVTSLAPEGRSGDVQRGATRVDRPGTSLDRDDGRSRSTERRWTRPVIRNGESDRGSAPDRPRVTPPSRDRSPNVDRSAPEPRRRNDDPRRDVDTPRRGSSSRESEDVQRSQPTPRVRPEPAPRARQESQPRVTPQRSTPERKGQVAPPRSSSSSDRTKAAPPPARNNNSGGASKATPSRGSSGGSRGGGGGDSKSRGGGRG